MTRLHPLEALEDVKDRFPVVLPDDPEKALPIAQAALDDIEAVVRKALAGANQRGGGHG